MSACLADFGTPVTCYDNDYARICGLAEGKVPFYERNLEDVIKRNVRAGRLVYSTDRESFANKSSIVFMAQDEDRNLEKTAEQVAAQMGEQTMMVVSTPAPVGTTTLIEQRIAKRGYRVSVVTQPVFLTDGCAVEDFNWPDRLVLGTSSPQAILLLKQIYRPLVMRGVPVIVTNHETAELAREASTAFVAAKISFINEVAGLCERVSADAVDLALALGLDKKIGPRCLQPGAALGGAFVESQMASLDALAQQHGVSLKILGAAREVSRTMCGTVVDKISALLHTISGKEVAIFGLAFKPHTSSVAGSASLAVARRLTSIGARVRAYDPVAIAEAKQQLQSSVRFCETPYAAAEGADAVVLGTGWPEFRALDFDRIKRRLRQPIIVDTKNLLDGERLRNMGYQYVGVGRS